MHRLSWLGLINLSNQPRAREGQGINLTVTLKIIRSGIWMPSQLVVVVHLVWPGFRQVTSNLLIYPEAAVTGRSGHFQRARQVRHVTQGPLIALPRHAHGPRAHLPRNICRPAPFPCARLPRPLGSRSLALMHGDWRRRIGAGVLRTRHACHHPCPSWPLVALHVAEPLVHLSRLDPLPDRCPVYSSDRLPRTS